MSKKTLDVSEFPEPKEADRLLERSRKFMEYAANKKKGNFRSKMVSLATMISLERQKAVAEYKRDNHIVRPIMTGTIQPPLTRLQHLWRVFFK